MSEQAATIADPTVEALEASWEHFFGAIRRAKVRAAREPSAGLSHAQFTLLRPLLGGESISVGDLAGGAGVTAPTASRMIDGLERDGLVTRQGSERDRRSVEIILTAEGTALARAKSDEFARTRETIYAELSVEERAQAAVLLERLAEAIETLL